MRELATGNGYIDDAVDALSSSNVFVASDVKDRSSLLTDLQHQVSGEDIAVAVVSTNATADGSTSLDIVQTMREAHPEYGTIIVAVGDDLAAGSSVLPAGQALQIANEAEGIDLGTSLRQTIAGVQTASIRDDNVALPEDGGAGLAIGIVLAIAAVLAGVGITVGLILGTRRRRVRTQNAMPDEVRVHLDALNTVRGEYAAAAASGNTASGTTAQEIGTLTANVAELFRRLESRSDEGQRKIAAVEYDDKLRRLGGALQRDYLLDIQTRPDLWDDPDERQREVQTALSAVSGELLENIRQVNAQRALRFQVSLDGLMGRRKELQDWDRAFDDAAPDGPSTGSGAGGSAGRPGGSAEGPRA
jgi:hypothetical protein